MAFDHILYISHKYAFEVSPELDLEILSFLRHVVAKTDTRYCPEGPNLLHPLL